MQSPRFHIRYRVLNGNICLGDRTEELEINQLSQFSVDDFSVAITPREASRGRIKLTVNTECGLRYITADIELSDSGTSSIEFYGHLVSITAKQIAG